MFCHLQNTKPGQDSSEWPAPPPGTYWPPELAAAMNDLRVSPHDIDPDQVLRLFVPEAPTVDQAKDRRLWALAEKLAEAFSVHTAATHLLEAEPDWDFTAVYYRTVDEISHMFMPYHPPRMAGIPEADYELYKHVVTGIYKLHDLFLCRLMQLVGPDTAIVLVSDHGFHSDHLRPKFTPRVPAGITIWHRPQGVFVACGPGFKRDELVYGARLLDVAPTILHWFGLPVGADMEGRVLEEAFDLAARRPVETVPTWEKPEGSRPARTSLGAGADKALLEQFVALGYIDEIPDDPGQAAAETNRENDWNIARACMYGKRYEQALPLLENCFHACPFRTDYAQVLATCQMQLGLLDEADATVAKAAETFGRTEQADLVRASIAIQKEDFHAAIAALERVREKSPGEVQLMLAQSYQALRRWGDAETAARRRARRRPAQPTGVFGSRAVRAPHRPGRAGGGGGGRVYRPPVRQSPGAFSARGGARQPGAVRGGGAAAGECAPARAHVSPGTAAARAGVSPTRAARAGRGLRVAELRNAARPAERAGGHAGRHAGAGRRPGHRSRRAGSDPAGGDRPQEGGI
ncbi:MAG: alkaline phosphatase family protein [Planctomycetota bacterium]